MSSRQTMVVKIGSQALCSDEGTVEQAVIDSLAAQVAALRADGWDLIVVSSGAVAAGRAVAGSAAERVSNPVTARQMLAAAGQVHLMAHWQRAFEAHDLITAQVLISKSDFQSRHHYLNTRACIEGILDAGLVPVVNENDVVSVTELMFTDNDELAGLLAGMVGAHTLCLLSSVRGVLDTDGDAVIRRWDDEQHSVESVVSGGTSRLGRGGMHSKIQVARKTARLGIPVVIADGRQPGVLEDVAAERHGGTTFGATSRATPAKRWLASMDDHALGAVYVNDGARDALLDPGRLASLLLVGVERVEGQFEKGDVIQVRDSTGKLLGCGRSGYHGAEARNSLGAHDQKPLIHYDYLYLI